MTTDEKDLINAMAFALAHRRYDSDSPTMRHADAVDFTAVARDETWRELNDATRALSRALTAYEQIDPYNEPDRWLTASRGLHARNHRLRALRARMLQLGLNDDAPPVPREYHVTTLQTGVDGQLELQHLTVPVQWPARAHTDADELIRAWLAELPVTRTQHLIYDADGRVREYIRERYLTLPTVLLDLAGQSVTSM